MTVRGCGRRQKRGGLELKSLEKEAGNKMMAVLEAFWQALYATLGPRLNWALLVLPALVVGFTVHEYAHAWMAVRLGDPTPRWDRRLTLNPLRHLDPVGTILVLVAFVGWAKPVRWNPANLKGVSYRTGALLVAAIGPVSNLGLAILGALVLRQVKVMGVASGEGVLPVVMDVLGVFVAFNVLLFVFNLIPLPPLDGYTVLRSLAPSSWYTALAVLEQYGTLVLILLLFWPGSPLGRFIGSVLSGILGVLI